MRAILLVLLFSASTVFAHPGSAIAVAKNGVVWFVDTGGGVFSVDGNGRVTRREGPAFHWFALDEPGRFRRTPWPSLPGAELRSTGDVVLSSDYPVTIGSDGRFYYPDGSSGSRIRIIAVDPSGARSVRATLPAIRRGGETITWLNGLAPAADGSLYYTEDRAVRKIDARGAVSTIAPNVTVPSCAAVPGVEAPTGPYLRGLAVAGDGSIYVAASGCAAVLKIDGKGRARIVLRASPPWSPTAIAISGADVYVLEYLHTASDNRAEWIPRIRKLSRDGSVRTIGVSTRR